MSLDTLSDVSETRRAKVSQFCLLCGAWRGQLGLEPTIDLYISHLLQITKEIWRALRKDGTFWLNIGDSYAGSGRGIGSAPDPKWKGARCDENKHKQNWSFLNKVNENSLSKNLIKAGVIGNKWTKPPIGLKPKDLCLIPFRLALALQQQGWWVRSDIIWAKPNPMPESVKDRPTRSHEYLFLLTKSGKATCWRHDTTKEWVWKEPKPDYIWVTDDKGKKRRVNLWKGYDYFWDQDAVRERLAESTLNDSRNATGRHTQGKNQSKYFDENSPDEAKPDKPSWYRSKTFVNPKNGSNIRSVWTIATQPYPEAHYATFPEELVERCIKAGCPKDGIVLDPFAGSGTVQRVAERLKGSIRKKFERLNMMARPNPPLHFQIAVDFRTNHGQSLGTKRILL